MMLVSINAHYYLHETGSQNKRCYMLYSMLNILIAVVVQHGINTVDD